MIVKADLKVNSPSSAMLMSSIFIQPPEASMSLKSAKVRDDFPAPVRPTIPTFSPGRILNETPR